MNNAYSHKFTDYIFHLSMLFVHRFYIGNIFLLWLLILFKLNAGFPVVKLVGNGAIATLGSWAEKKLIGIVSIHLSQSNCVNIRFISAYE